MSLPTPTPDTTVVVTGASSGIGLEIAHALARRKYPLILVARREDRLHAIAKDLIDAHDVAVDVLPLDLAAANERARLVERLSDGDVVGLCNNAGFGTSGAFASLPIDREREQITLNAMAVAELTHAALPAMLTRRRGAILNVASIAAFQPLPGMAIYSATKAFVQTFSEALHTELHGTGVSCTTLCPGPVPTEWADIADAERFSIGVAQVSPRAVADAAVAGMLDGKRSVVPGLVPTVASIGGRFAPRTLLLPALRLLNKARP